MEFVIGGRGKQKKPQYNSFGEISLSLGTETITYKATELWHAIV